MLDELGKTSCLRVPIVVDGADVGEARGVRATPARRRSRSPTRRSWRRSPPRSRSPSAGRSCSRRSRRSPTRTRSPGSPTAARSRSAWRRRWAPRRSPAARWRCCSATSTGSRRSTTPTATRRATPRSLRVARRAAAAALAVREARSSAASAATSSASCSRAIPPARRASSRSTPSGAGSAPLTMSCGAAELQHQGERPADLFRAADAAQYVAKRAGRGRVYVAQPGALERDGRRARSRARRRGHERSPRARARRLEDDLAGAPVADRMEAVTVAFADAFDASGWAISAARAGSRRSSTPCSRAVAAREHVSGVPVAALQRRRATSTCSRTTRPRRP